MGMLTTWVIFISAPLLAHCQHVAVFNKGNITLKLDMDSSVQGYTVYLLPNGRVLPDPVRTSTDVNITGALSYTSYMFDVRPRYTNGSVGNNTRIRYSNPNVLAFKVSDTVTVAMDLSEKSAGGYTIVNEDTSKTMFDILNGKDTLSKDDRFAFSDDKNNRIHFNISRVGLADAGHIVAKANDKHLGDLILIVTDGPTKPVVMANGTLIAGEDAIFNCDVQSTSLPEYYRFKIPLIYNWYVDNAPRTTAKDKILRLETISKDDKGKTIFCRAEENGTMSEESNRAVIDPIYGPDVVNIVSYQEVVRVLEHSEVGPYNCTADCNPACNMSWTFKYPNGTFKSNKLPTTGYIDLGRVNRTSTGYYRCVAIGSSLLSTDKRKKYEQFHLDVLYPAEIKSVFPRQSNGETKAYENDNVIFVCEVSGNPQPNVTWTRINGDVIATQQNVGVVMNHTMSRLKCSDTGNYTCTSDNGLGKPEARTVSLSVLCAPRLDPAVKFRSEYGAQINTDVIISVQVITNPKSTLSWKQQSRTNITEPIYTQLNPYTYKIGSTIRISNKEDFGVYTFLLQGQNENATYNVTITAAGAPRLDPAVKFRSEYGVQINTDVNISVQVISNPKSTLSWKQQSRTNITEPIYTQLNPYTYKIGSTIRISNKEDFGVYTFLLQGQNENATYNVTITAAGVPSKVENLTVSSVTHNSVNITWAPGFDGGGTQNFRIYISDYSGSWDVYDTVEDPGNRHLLGIEVGNLKPDTSYKYKIESCNKYGCQEETPLIDVQTKEAPAAMESLEDLSGGSTLLIGTVGAAVFVILAAVIVVMVILWKRKKANAESQEEVLYASVNKAGQDTASGQDNPADGNNDGQVKDPLLGNPTGAGNDTVNPIGNPTAAAEAAAGNPGRSQNQDGLIYIDVEFTKPPNSAAPDKTMSIIHGDDERTEYMSVQFTQNTQAPEQEGTYGNM